MNPPTDNFQKMVVKETLYWQSRGSNPQSVPGSFVRTNVSDEVPYSRPKIKVGEAWHPLDIGWLDKSCMVVVENLPEVRRTIPTREEARAARAKVLEIAVSEGGATLPFRHVPVGESARLCPPYGNVSGFRMRCLSGETQVNVTAFPGGY